MNARIKLLSSSIGLKLLIGLSGLALIGFVVVHLAGNLLLYAGLEQYNTYAHALHSQKLILPIAEVALLVLFVTHIALAIKVTRQHRQARTQAYGQHRSKQGRTKATASALMIVSGFIILGFLFLHLADMRFNLRNAVGPEVEPATHTLLVLQDPVSAIVYFLGSLFLGYHIWHAFQSVFQTYGLNHHQYTPWIKRVGKILAIILALGFASFPVWGMLVRLQIF